MELTAETIAAILGLATAALSTTIVFLLVRGHRLRRQYGKIIDVDREVAVRRKETDRIESRCRKLAQQEELLRESLEEKRQKWEHQAQARQKALQADYAGKRTLYDELLRSIASAEQSLDLQSYGVYEPYFDFDTPQDYKERLGGVRQLQKQMVREKTAATCSTTWSVDGSKREGQKMTNRTIKMMLRAFHGECDAAISRVRWNNAVSLEDRITRSFHAINKMGEPHHAEISPEYLELKIDELHLAHEYAEKRQLEKEEQRELREQMREEECARKELEKAITTAQAEEDRYERALEKARQEVGEQASAELQRLQQLLDEAHERRERAIARAQLTRSGHVYVISNIGSFGEDVYKIGMTRRLEPMDRVRELGDASVPFPFDVHAMMFSEDAPGLEKAIHRALQDQQVNRVNSRKEFFRVTLDDIQRAAVEHGSTAEFTRVAEARQFRESAALQARDQEIDRQQQQSAHEFPASLEMAVNTAP